MGLLCLLGLHDRWSGWQYVERHQVHPYWRRQCGGCGETERRYRAPAGICGMADDDHDWEGSRLLPLKRRWKKADGEEITQSYRFCRTCGIEHVFHGFLEDDDDGEED